MRLFRASAALLSIYAAVLGGLMAWLIPQPLLVFEGAVEGWVSLLAYSVYAFHRPVEIPGFESLRLPGYMLLSYSILLVLASTLVLLRLYAGRGPRLGVTVEAFVGVALGALPMLAVLKGASILLYWERKFLARNYTFETNAGLIELGRATARLTPAGHVLLGLPLTTALAVLGVAAMFLLVFYWAIAETSVEEVEDTEIGLGGETSTADEK